MVFCCSEAWNWNGHHGIVNITKNKQIIINSNNKPNIQTGYTNTNKFRK